VVGEISAAVSTFCVWYLHTLPESGHVAGYVIIGGLSVVEAFWSMSNVGWTALISDLYPEQKRAGLQGKLSSIGAVGRMVGVWVGGLLYDGCSQFYDGWGFERGWLFFVASGAMVFSIIPMLFAPEGGIKKDKEKIGIEDGREFSLSKLFLVFLIAMVFINFGRNSVALIKAQYLSLEEGFNVSSSLLSHIVNMSSAAIFFVGLFIRRLSDRLKDDVVLLIGSVVALLSLLGFAMAENLPLIFASNFLAGASQTVIFASSYSYASIMIPAERRGRQFALFNATFFLSWGIPGTLIAGPIVDQLIKSGATQVFSYKMSFLTAAALVLVGTLVLLFAIRKGRGTS
jgi:MFS family permease